MLQFMLVRCLPERASLNIQIFRVSFDRAILCRDKYKCTCTGIFGLTIMLLFTNLRLAHNICRPKCRWMSVRPPTKMPSSSSTARKKVTIEALYQLRQSKTPITVLTAYDYPSALACSSSHLIDITLVGDSLAQVCLGYESTTQLTLDDMVHHTRAVARGTTHPFLVADMPFGSYHTSVDDAVSNAIKLVQVGRAEAVKLEGGQEIASIIRRLTEVGIPVMAHIGLLPQRHSAMSGYKVQGRSAEEAKKVVTDALAIEEAGAFAVVVEAVPRELGKYVTDCLKIPTIGIGAGPWTSGQVCFESE